MNAGLIALFIFLGIAVIVLSIVIPLAIINKKYNRFVLKHSLAIKELEQINNHYHFNVIRECEYRHSYDNDAFYNTISPKDYLIYQLVYLQKEVSKSLNNAYGNKIMFEQYQKEIAEKCHLNSFDTEELLNNKKKLAKMEQKLFKQETKNPKTTYSITVILHLTKINGSYVRSKSNTFNSQEIRSLISRINNKKNDFYLDEEIWNAICRVERGKVTNKIRFAIYFRDGYRCKKCGRKTKDLEIDHIIPIAKGGKTTYNNLQTLCHRCNVKKGADLE